MAMLRPIGLPQPGVVSVAQASRDQAGQTFDVIVVGSGASGGWAAKRLSEAGISVALLDAGRALTDARLQGTRGALHPRVPQPRQRSHPSDPEPAEGLLRLHRVQLRLVRQRQRRAVHDAERQAVLVAGAHAHHRRAHQHLGSPELPVQRLRLQGGQHRRPRHRLADCVQGPRVLLRHGRGVRRHLGHARERPDAARQQVPPADGPQLRRASRAQRHQEGRSTAR